jgi:hypothetical protein
MSPLILAGALGLAVSAFVVGVFRERRNGHSWSEALQTHAFSVGPTGIIGAQLFLTGTPRLVIGFKILVPTVAITLRRVRSRLGRVFDQLALSTAPIAGGRGEAVHSPTPPRTSSDWSRHRIRRLATAHGVTSKTDHRTDLRVNSCVASRDAIPTYFLDPPMRAVLGSAP